MNRLVLRLLGSAGHRVLGGKVCALRYRTAGGATVELPVQYVHDGDRLVVVAGGASGKRWWRHFRTAAPVEVLVDGNRVTGSGAVLGGAERDAALDAYRRAFPHVTTDAQVVAITIGRFPAGRPPLRGAALFRTWLPIVTLAEFLGFAVPAGVGALTADGPAALVVPALLAVGAVEGAALGWGQAAVLRRALPGLPRSRWVAATSAAAVVAYLVGLAPSTWGAAITSWHPVPMVATAAVLGCVLLGSIGTAQWLLLRHHLPRAGRWIAATAAAWLLGLAVFLGFTMPLWHPGQALATAVLIGIAGGLLMAATTAAVTGFALRRLLPQR
ncbi:hypothetical protein [Saccharothrix longispora]|uniref:hypothetical protein n=1 Tax=Saccharothrix longispora TaxID=33920 RepID=UPI0028FD61C3|nr:hypothetical protein [Saccharothrix longispora]MDU0294665.1 hypothetical protein [Saccharothrix longispora]